MLKRPISYTDYNDQDVKDEIFYFNLTSDEINKLELGMRDGIVRTLTSLALSDDREPMYDFIRNLVLNSYGEKSEDGKRFRKLDDDGKKLSIAFSEHAAFVALLDELLENDQAATAFLQGIFPKKYQEAMNDPDNIKSASEHVEQLKQKLGVAEAPSLPDIAGDAKKQKAEKAGK